MATVTAFIRTSRPDKPTKIRFRLTSGRNVQLFYVSDILILPAHWSASRQAIKPKVAIDEVQRVFINESISKVKEEMLRWYSSLDDSSQATSERFVSYMNRGSKQTSKRINSQELFAMMLSEKRYSKVREKGMKVVLRDITRYEKYRTVVGSCKYVFDIGTTSKQDLLSFERFLEDEHKICTVYPDLYAKERPCSPRGRNTIIGIMKKVRVFFNWAVSNGYTSNYPFKNYPIEEAVYGTPIYVDTSELKRLYKTNLNRHPSLAVQRDIFVFQSCLGCRFGDLVQLKDANLIDGYIEYIPRKTKEGRPVTVRVPVNSMAREILSRYPVNGPSAPLLPFISNQKYNDAIKRIFLAARLKRMVTILDPLTRESVLRPLYEVASSHMARRTFIGNIYKRVRDQNLVSALSGHKDGSKAFARYRNIDDDMRQDMVRILDEADE